MSSLPAAFDQGRRTAARLALVTDDPSWEPTMAFYLGYATATAIVSPSRAVADALMRASVTRR